MIYSLMNIRDFHLWILLGVVLFVAGFFFRKKRWVVQTALIEIRKLTYQNASLMDQVESLKTMLSGLEEGKRAVAKQWESISGEMNAVRELLKDKVEDFLSGSPQEGSVASQLVALCQRASQLEEAEKDYEALKEKTAALEKAQKDAQTNIEKLTEKLEEASDVLNEKEEMIMEI